MVADMARNHIVTLTDAPILPYRFKNPIFHGGIAKSVIPDHGRMRQGKGFRDEPLDFNQPVARRGLLRRGRGDADGVKRLSGRYMFAGPLWNHFGHVFVDCVHRLWAARDGAQSWDGIVFVGVQGLVGVRTEAQLRAVKPPKYLLELLKLIDIPDLPIHMVTEPTVVDKLDVPRAGAGARGPIYPFYRYWLDRYQDSLESKLELHRRRAPRRILLSRSHLLRHGGVIGSSWLESELMKTGTVSLTPESLSLALQFGHLLGAETIIADEGSALHPTQVMARVPGEVLMFPRRAQNEIYSMALSARGRFAQLVPPDQITMLPDRYGGVTSPGMLAAYADPAALFAALAERGLVEGTFDAAAYHAAEIDDLIASDPVDHGVHDKRMAILNELRGR